MTSASDDEIPARVERLLTAQPTAPPESRRVRRRVEIADRWRESQRYIGVRMEVDAEFAQAYRRPAQYATLKVPGWPARFYVIASRPSDNVWEFLIDRQGELGPVLGKLDVGDELKISMPEGVGFDPDEAAGKPAVMFCTGSGIATMRPLIERFIDPDSPGPAAIALYYGERRPGDFAYESLLETWHNRGVSVHRAVERDDGDCPHRYVQHAFDADHPSMDDAFVYLSGAPVMIQIVADKMLHLGVAPTRVKVNI